MRWRGERQSGNVEDNRGGSGGKIAIGGGIGTIIIVVLGLLMGKDPTQILNQVTQQQTTQTSSSRNIDPATDTVAQLVSTVLASTEDVWGQIFKQAGATYQQPKLRLFSGSEATACGQGESAMGPFYCPSDQKVYIDLAFCDELAHKFKAPGNFAIAYVVAHEVGHHVQNLLGTSDKVAALRGKVSEEEYNKYSVALELQADFYAGLWANRANQLRGILEPGDLEVALTAANAIGDDKLQKEAMGYTVPDAFTHGTSAQRMEWFKKGFQTGDINQGNTFKALGLSN